MINLIMNHLVRDLQKSSALAITRVIKGIYFQFKILFNEFGLESLKSWRKLRHLCILRRKSCWSVKLSIQINTQQNAYLSDNKFRWLLIDRGAAVKLSIFSFPWTIIEWNKIDISVWIQITLNSRITFLKVTSAKKW